VAAEDDFPVYYPENGPGDFYDENGVDRTQIRAMLRLTPEQRLRYAQRFAEDTLRVWTSNGLRRVR
jgi:hypothetical protein